MAQDRKRRGAALLSVAAAMSLSACAVAPDLQGAPTGLEASVRQAAFNAEASPVAKDVVAGEAAASEDLGAPVLRGAEARETAITEAASARYFLVRSAITQAMIQQGRLDRPETAPPLQQDLIAVTERQRGAVVEHVPFEVSLWMRRADDRQFMVNRADKQPMFDLDWSRERAELAVAQAYGEDCRGAKHLSLIRSVWDPVGLWVIDGVCR